MRSNMLCVFFPALLTASFLCAQPTTTFTFRAVAQPGTTVDGHTFTKDTTIDRAVINDVGEVAFVATDANVLRGTTIFTSHRLIVRHRDVIDGKIIVQVLSEPLLAINAAGQVAYMAWYAENQKEVEDEPAGIGVFVDRHFVLKVQLVGSPETIPAFTLTDDGRILPEPGHLLFPRKTSLLDRIPRKLPKSLPISITPKWSTEGHPTETKSSPQFPTNRTGQVLIPVNFDQGGFLLLLGTPKAK